MNSFPFAIKLGHSLYAIFLCYKYSNLTGWIVKWVNVNISKLFKLSILFQRSLFLRITTLLSWLKSTLLLKNKCFGIDIYMKTQCLQTNETQHYCRKKNTWEARRGRERVALIKCLITRDRKDTLEARLEKIKLNLSADN